MGASPSARSRRRTAGSAPWPGAGARSISAASTGSRFGGQALLAPVCDEAPVRGPARVEGPHDDSPQAAGLGVQHVQRRRARGWLTGEGKPLPIWSPRRVSPSSATGEPRSSPVRGSTTWMSGSKKSFSLSVSERSKAISPLVDNSMHHNQLTRRAPGWSGNCRAPRTTRRTASGLAINQSRHRLRVPAEAVRDCSRREALVGASGAHADGIGKRWGAFAQQGGHTKTARGPDRGLLGPQQLPAWRLGERRR